MQKWTLDYMTNALSFLFSNVLYNHFEFSSLYGNSGFAALTLLFDTVNVFCLFVCFGNLSLRSTMVSHCGCNSKSPPDSIHTS